MSYFAKAARPEFKAALDKVREQAHNTGSNAPRPGPAGNDPRGPAASPSPVPRPGPAGNDPGPGPGQEQGGDPSDRFGGTPPGPHGASQEQRGPGPGGPSPGPHGASQEQGGSGPGQEQGGDPSDRFGGTPPGPHGSSQEQRGPDPGGPSPRGGTSTPPSGVPRPGPAGNDPGPDPGPMGGEPPSTTPPDETPDAGDLAGDPLSRFGDAAPGPMGGEPPFTTPPDEAPDAGDLAGDPLGRFGDAAPGPMGADAPPTPPATLEEARVVLDAATAALDAPKAAYEEAPAALEAPRATYNEAVAERESLKLAYEEAGAAIQEPQTAYEQAVASLEAPWAELEAANAALDSGVLDELESRYGALDGLVARYRHHEGVGDSAGMNQAVADYQALLSGAAAALGFGGGTAEEQAQFLLEHDNGVRAAVARQNAAVSAYNELLPGAASAEAEYSQAVQDQHLATDAYQAAIDRAAEAAAPYQSAIDNQSQAIAGLEEALGREAAAVTRFNEFVDRRNAQGSWRAGYADEEVQEAIAHWREPEVQQQLAEWGQARDEAAKQGVFGPAALEGFQERVETARQGMFGPAAREGFQERLDQTLAREEAARQGVFGPAAQEGFQEQVDRSLPAGEAARGGLFAADSAERVGLVESAYLSRSRDPRYAESLAEVEARQLGMVVSAPQGRREASLTAEEYEARTRSRFAPESDPEYLAQQKLLHLTAEDLKDPGGLPETVWDQSGQKYNLRELVALNMGGAESEVSHSYDVLSGGAARAVPPGWDDAEFEKVARMIRELAWAGRMTVTDPQAPEVVQLGPPSARDYRARTAYFDELRALEAQGKRVVVVMPSLRGQRMGGHFRETDGEYQAEVDAYTRTIRALQANGAEVVIRKPASAKETFLPWKTAHDAATAEEGAFGRLIVPDENTAILTGLGLTAAQFIPVPLGAAARGVRFAVSRVGPPLTRLRAAPVVPAPNQVRWIDGHPTQPLQGTVPVETAPLREPGLYYPRDVGGPLAGTWKYRSVFERGRPDYNRLSGWPEGADLNVAPGSLASDTVTPKLPPPYGMQRAVVEEIPLASGHRIPVVRYAESGGGTGGAGGGGMGRIDPGGLSGWRGGRSGPSVAPPPAGGFIQQPSGTTTTGLPSDWWKRNPPDYDPLSTPRRTTMSLHMPTEAEVAAVTASRQLDPPAPGLASISGTMPELGTAAPSPPGFQEPSPEARPQPEAAPVPGDDPIVKTVPLKPLPAAPWEAPRVVPDRVPQATPYPKERERHVVATPAVLPRETGAPAALPQEFTPPRESPFVDPWGDLGAAPLRPAQPATITSPFPDPSPFEGLEPAPAPAPTPGQQRRTRVAPAAATSLDVTPEPVPDPFPEPEPQPEPFPLRAPAAGGPRSTPPPPQRLPPRPPRPRRRRLRSGAGGSGAGGAAAGPTPNTGGEYPAVVEHQVEAVITTDLDTGEHTATLMELKGEPEVVARQARPAGKKKIRGRNLDVEVMEDGSVDLSAVHYKGEHRVVDAAGAPPAITPPAAGTPRGNGQQGRAPRKRKAAIKAPRLMFPDMGGRPKPRGRRPPGFNPPRLPGQR